MKNLIISIILSIYVVLVYADGCTTYSYIVDNRVISCQTCCWGGHCQTSCKTVR